MSPFEILIGENPRRAQDLNVAEFIPGNITPKTVGIYNMLVGRAKADMSL